MISIISDKKLIYPTDNDFYSPGIRYPEYIWDHLSSSPNLVYDAVRECFRQAEPDASRFGTAQWNPLSQWIKPGQQVFVLCNFVYQRRPRESKADFFGKCIHGSVLRAVVDYILIAVGISGRVYVGNASLQSCNWASVLSDTGADKVLEFYRQRGLPVVPADLRLLVAERKQTRKIHNIERRGESDGILIDLGKDSCLNEITLSETRFRVHDYDSRRLGAFHGIGKHIYVINRKILDSDIIFSVPKLKTHEKTGISCVIKGCVGTVGQKDCLPHYRFGPLNLGGDEYPIDIGGVRPLISSLHDKIQTLPLENQIGRGLRIFDEAFRTVARRLLPVTGGAWSGNNTCWRMAVDLAKIVSYANADGVMQGNHVRHHLALVDGIIGGEGEGPLSPKAVNSGTLIFGDTPVLVDYVAATMMGYPPQRLPIVWEALKSKKYPLLLRDIKDEELVFNGLKMGLDDIKNYVTHKYRPPFGWKDHLK